MASQVIPYPAPAAADSDLLERIRKLASYVARNGPEFEAKARERECNNPSFSFLFDETSEENRYYKWMLFCCQLQLSADAVAALEQQHAEYLRLLKPPGCLELTFADQQQLSLLLQRNSGSKDAIAAVRSWVLQHAHSLVHCGKLMQQHCAELLIEVDAGVLSREEAYTQTLFALYAVNDIFSNRAAATILGPYTQLLLLPQQQQQQQQQQQLGQQQEQQQIDVVACLLPSLPVMLAACCQTADSDAQREKVTRLLRLWTQKKYLTDAVRLELQQQQQSDSDGSSSSSTNKLLQYPPLASPFLQHLPAATATATTAAASAESSNPALLTHLQRIQQKFQQHQQQSSVAAAASDGSAAVALAQQQHLMPPPPPRWLPHPPLPPSATTTTAATAATMTVPYPPAPPPFPPQQQQAMIHQQHLLLQQQQQSMLQSISSYTQQQQPPPPPPQFASSTAAATAALGPPQLALPPLPFTPYPPFFAGVGYSNSINGINMQLAPPLPPGPPHPAIAAALAAATTTPAAVLDLARVSVGTMANVVRAAKRAGQPLYRPIDFSSPLIAQAATPYIEPGRLEARVAEFYRFVEKIAQMQTAATDDDVAATVEEEEERDVDEERNAAAAVDVHSRRGGSRKRRSAFAAVEEQDKYRIDYDNQDDSGIDVELEAEEDWEKNVPGYQEQKLRRELAANAATTAAYANDSSSRKYARLGADSAVAAAAAAAAGISEDNVGHKLLRGLGWQEGKGLGAAGAGIVEPILANSNSSSNNSNNGGNNNSRMQRDDKRGVGAASTAAAAGDSVEAYRQQQSSEYYNRIADKESKK